MDSQPQIKTVVLAFFGNYFLTTPYAADHVVFDAKTGTVLASLDVDGCTEFYALDGKGMIYDSLEDKATVIAIDARSMRVTATYARAGVTWFEVRKKNSAMSPH